MPSMMKRSLYPCLFLLALAAASMAAAPGDGAAVRLPLRIAAADQQFESTEAPDVKLEKPESLERLVPPPAGEETPQAEPPAEGASDPATPEATGSGPDWFEKAKDRIGAAMDEDAGTATEGETGAAGEDAPASRGLGESIVQSFVALLVVLALILACTYLLKRFGKRTPLLAGASLGTVLGRVYLSPKASLHFVRVQNTVLVVGITPAGMTSIARLDASLFEGSVGALGGVQASKDASSFLAHLKNSRQPNSSKEAENEDDEIAALRGDLARLQQYLQDSSRDVGE